MGNFITTNKKSKVQEKFNKAIIGMWVDKIDRLWVASSRERKEGDNKVYFDIYKKGIYLNTVTLEDFESKSLCYLWHHIFFKGEYLFVIDNREDGSIKVYDY